LFLRLSNYLVGVQDEVDDIPSGKKTDEQIITEAKDRYKLIESAETNIRADFLDDMRFYSGIQWPDIIKTERNKESRPCLTVNRLPGAVHQITNDQKQNKPAIKVLPIGDGADEITAELLGDMIRHIEKDSHAEVAYDTAFDNQVIGGRGWARITKEYCDELSFNMKLVIKPVLNALSIMFDPGSKMPDGSDANFAFVSDSMQKSHFKKEYPESFLGGIDDWASFGPTSDGWIEQDRCRVVEYYTKEWVPKTIGLLSNHDVIDLADIEGDPETANYGYLDAEKTKPIQLLAKRRTLVPEVHHFKLTGKDVLERTIWECPWIPVFPFIGERIELEGKTIYVGLVKHAKDPQRMLNYWVSAETEGIALAPKAPWVIPQGADEGFEEEWATANTENHSALHYKPINVAGQLVPAPQRNSVEPPVEAITRAKAGAVDDFKSTTNIYDPTLGTGPADTSGIAIQRRNTQAQNGNFHFVDNAAKTQKHMGRVLVYMIPKVYDTNRIVRITKVDGQQDQAEINGIASDGIKPVNDLSIGTYDVEVSTGPSFATRRQEAAQSMENVIKAYPQLFNIMGDLLFKNLDYPGADEMAARIRKTIPPQLLEDDKKNPVPPQAVAQIQQMGQMIQKLSQALQANQQIIENKKIELSSKERIEYAKLQVDVEKTLANLKSKDGQILLEHTLAALQMNQGILNQEQSLAPNQQNLNPQGPGQATAAPGINQQPTGGNTPG
jgi:hypothetical protein